MTKEIIVLDTETTGVNSKEDSLIEIAAAKVVDGQVVDQFQTLVKPIKTPLNTTVSVLTGIKPEDLENAPDISEIKDKLLEFVGELPITGHNISFDTDFLKANNIDPPGHSFDTLDLVIAVLPKLPYHSMQFLAQYLKLPAKPSHRAMDDVLATADLVNVIIGYVQNLPEPILKNIREVLAKSDWEWSWVFDAPSWQTIGRPLLDFSRHSGEAPLGGLTPESYNNQSIRSWTPLRLKATDGQASQDDGIIVSPDKIKTGLNFYELPPDTPQIPTNIALAAEDEQSVLVVSNNVFNQTDWSQYKLNPQFGSTVQLDADRFKFLLDKPKLKSTEAKLLIKVFLIGYPQTLFNPSQIYLSRDEYYLWEQKLAPFEYTPTSPNPSPQHPPQQSRGKQGRSGRRGAIINPPLDEGRLGGVLEKSVMNFSTLWEILENHPDILKDKHIYLPQWLEFTDWALFKSVRIFTELYLHAAVSSRRDYVHDFVEDNKQADEMFKLLNNFGAQINSLWESIRQLWKTVEADKTIEVNDLLINNKSGQAVAKFAEQASQTLTKFLDKVKSAPAHPAQLRQIEHTQKLIEHLQALSGTTEHKVYLEGYLDRVTMYVVKFPITNIWQRLVPPLVEGRLGGVQSKNLSVIIASNNLIASGSDDFMASIFGAPITINPISPPARPALRMLGGGVGGGGSIEKETFLSKPSSSRHPEPPSPRHPGPTGQGPSSDSGSRAQIPDQARNDAGQNSIKPIKIVKSLPDRKSSDYEDKVFNYLRQNLQPNQKNMVVFSNNAQVGIFFEKYYQQIPDVDIISYNVAGNSEILADKLAQKSGFTLLVSNSNLVKYTKSIQNLDRVIFLTLPFDPPGTLGQVLATAKLKNDFTDYSLPRATLKFKLALAELYDKTQEIWILDSRLVNADWARPILSSLSNFQITEI